MNEYDLSQRAVDDIVAAREWYEQQQIDLGNEFFDAVLLAIRAAREHPERYPEVQPGVRGIICLQFPYRVYYEVRAGKIVIRAVYHTARDPSGWDNPNRE